MPAKVVGTGLVVATWFACMLVQASTNANSHAMAGPDSDLEVLRHRVVTSLIPTNASEVETLSETAKSLLANLSTDGSWGDIDYHPPASQDTRSVWPPLMHADRVLTLAKCINTPNTWCSHSREGNGSGGSGGSGGMEGEAKDLLEGLELALDFWLLANLTNPDNWCVTVFSQMQHE